MQLCDLGKEKYIVYVGVPSVIGYNIDSHLKNKYGYDDYPYYSQPWEYGADFLADVDRKKYHRDDTTTPYTYAPWADKVYNIYNTLINLDDIVKNSFKQAFRQSIFEPKFTLPMNKLLH